MVRARFLLPSVLVAAACLACGSGGSPGVDGGADLPDAVDPGPDAGPADAGRDGGDDADAAGEDWPEGITPIRQNDPTIPLAGGLPAETAFDTTSRRVVDLSGTWRFRFDDAGEGIAAGWFRPEHGRADWRDIAVPAAWDLALDDGFDRQTAGWYARTFAWDGDDPFVRLRFEGVFREARVWLNGVELGADDLPWLPFAFDVTDVLKPGDGNLLVVQIDNRLDRDTLPCDTTPNPGRHGWFPYGGITRPVVLEGGGATSVGRVHVRTLPEGEDGWRLDARLFLHRGAAAASRVTVSASVTRDGQEVLAWGPVDVDAPLAGLRLEGAVPDAAPWSPETPDAVYRLNVRVRDWHDPMTGMPERVPEDVAVDFAFKRFQATGGRFLLNGRDRYLRGINRHEDHPDHGPVFDAAGAAADVAAMNALGVDFCRPAHYPNDVRTLRALEAAGILLAEEIPVYQWDGKQMATPVLVERADRALRRMIVRDVNRPAMAMWSIANEVWSFVPEAVPFFDRLAATARALDPDRPVMAALLAAPVVSFSEADAAPEAVDVIGVNEYLGWYTGPVDDAGPYLDAAHARYPDKTLFLSEFGAGALRGRTLFGPPSQEPVDEHSYTEEHQAWFLRQHLRQAAARGFVRGVMPWVLADFRMQWTPSTGKPHPVPGYNLKGVLDAWRLPKQSFAALAAAYACGRPGSDAACEGDSGLSVSAEPACGDGRVDPGEACDGGAGNATTDCTALGATWASGSAHCRPDCLGWVVSGCVRAAPTVDTWEMVKPALRDPARWGDARCNDGSPYGFRVRVSPTGSRDWVISLRGGGFCDGWAVPCIRHDYLMSTPPQADGTLFVPDDENGGVFDADPTANPVWQDANWAFGPYCSSDFFTGTRTHPIPAWPVPDDDWYFSGRLNVQALLETLVRRYGLDDRVDVGARILYGGTSAGAIGTLATVDLAAAILPHAAGSGRLRILVDAGWLVHDWDEEDARLILADVSDREVVRRNHAFFQARTNPRCEAARIDDGGHPGDCLLGLHAFDGLVDAPPRGLGLPVLFQQSLQDTSFAGFHNHDDDSAFQVRYGERQLADVLAADPDGALRAWWFLGHAPYHDIHRWTGRWLKGDAGDTFRDVLERFFAGGAPERVIWTP
jgi:beta-glucuronidase